MQQALIHGSQIYIYFRFAQPPYCSSFPPRCSPLGGPPSSPSTSLWGTTELLLTQQGWPLRLEVSFLLIRTPATVLVVWRGVCVVEQMDGRCTKHLPWQAPVVLLLRQMNIGFLALRSPLRGPSQDTVDQNGDMTQVKSRVARRKKTGKKLLSCSIELEGIQ